MPCIVLTSRTARLNCSFFNIRSQYKSCKFTSGLSKSDFHTLSLRVRFFRIAPLVTCDVLFIFLFADFCDNLDKLDLIAETVSQYNKDLVTWSSWKASSLSSFGVKHLANCHSLQELDFGWCLILSDPGDCLERIALGCKDLRR